VYISVDAAEFVVDIMMMMMMMMIMMMMKYFVKIVTSTLD